MSFMWRIIEWVRGGCRVGGALPVNEFLPPQAVIPGAEATKEDHVKTTIKSEPTKAEPAVPAASFTHLEDLLEQIPNCRKMLRKLRKIDPEAYDWNAKFGARMLPYHGNLWSDYIETRIDPRFYDALPSAGMSYILNHSETTESNIASCVFEYFQKISSDSNVLIPKNARAVYRVSLVHKWKKKIFVAAYHVAIFPDRSVSVLRELAANNINLAPRKVSGFSNRQGGAIKRFGFTIPEQVKSLENDPKCLPGVEKERKPIVFFLMTAHVFINTTSGFQIRCEKDGESVSFSVAPKRTAYFFKDRSTTLAVDGRRKRIFHFVEAHQRTRGEKTITVAPHYRGERNFIWNGENVSITAPENSVKEINVNSYVLDDDEDMKDAIAFGSAAKMLLGALESRPHNIHNKGVRA